MAEEDTIRDYYDNGNQRLVATFKDDQIDGIEKFSDQDGTLICELTYSQGKLLDKDGKPFNGEQTCSDTHGTLRLKFQVKDGLKNGLKQIFFNDGTIWIEEKYRDGEKKGVSKEFFQNHNLKSEIAFDGDVLDGPFKYYHENGSVKVQGKFRAGQLIGKMTAYYPSGAIMTEGLYTAIKGSALKDISQLFEDNFMALNREGKAYYPDGKLWLEFKISSNNNKKHLMRFFDEKGEELKSISDYDQLIQDNSDDIELYYRRGLANRNMRHMNEAILDFTQVLNRDPQHSYAHYHRGNVYYKKGEYSLALEDLTKVKGLLSSDYKISDTIDNIYYLRGWDYYLDKQYEKALADFRWLIENAPDFDNLYKVYNNVGAIYTALGQNEKAVEYYEKTIGINHYYKAYYNRASAYAEMKKADLAIADYQKSIALRHDYLGAYQNLGNIYKDRKDYEQALFQYNSAHSVDRTYTLAYISRANVYRKMGDVDKALKELELVKAIDPDDEDIYYNSANFLKEKGEFDAALNSYNKAIELNPKFTDAYIYRGLLYKKIGKIEEAQKDFEKAIDSDSKSISAYNKLAFFLLEKNDLQAAQVQLDIAYGLDQQNSETFSNMATWHMLNGNNKGRDQQEYYKAIEYFNKAIEISPDDADLFNNLAAVYFNLKDMAKVQENLDKVKELGGEPAPGLLQMLNK